MPDAAARTEVDVVVKALAELGVQVCTDVVALQRSVLQDTLLVHITHRGEVLELVCSAAGGEVVLAGKAERVVDERPVVRIGIQAAILEALDTLGSPERGLVVHLAGLVVPVDILVCGKKVRGDGVRVERSRTVVDNLRLSPVTALSRNHDNAVSAADAVDSGSRCVLEDGDRLDIIRVDVLDRALYSVYEDKRGGVIEGRGTANEQRCGIAARDTCRLNGGHTGEAACEHRTDVCVRGFQEILAADLRNGADYEFLFLGSITDDQNLLKDILVFFEDYIDLNAMLPYEPGSVAKPFTVAAGIDSGKMTGEEVYFCGGSLEVGGFKIKCHNRYGDGQMTVKKAVEQSCNVALMKMGQQMGKDTYLDYFQRYNFGYKTNIDLAGEAKTNTLVFTDKTMGPTELATCTFGQGFQVTMIEMIAAFNSLINGGYYYQPHMVSQILDSNGAVVRNIEPCILKQTISQSTSDKIIDYCNAVVTSGTGKKARPAGYAVGGKTGTAETFPRGRGEYVTSFMGYAPANDPKIIIYAVIDRPNMPDQQSGTAQACLLVKDILTEVLPYMNVFMTEELTEAEIEDLKSKGLYNEAIYRPEEHDDENDEGITPVEDNPAIPADKAVDPDNGEKLDPNTGYPLDPNSSDLENLQEDGRTLEETKPEAN